MKKIFSIVSILALSSALFAADTFTVVRANKAKRTTQPVFADTVFDITSLSANTTTPSVSAYSVLLTGTNTGATTITGFSGATVGQVITIIGKSNTSVYPSKINDSGAFKLNGQFVASANNVIRILVRGAGDYVELGRSTNL